MSLARDQDRRADRTNSRPAVVDGLPRSDERRRRLPEVLRTDASTRATPHRAAPPRVPRSGDHGAGAAPDEALDAGGGGWEEARRGIRRRRAPSRVARDPPALRPAATRHHASDGS